MMECNVTVLIQIDGCRSDYINKEKTPFLFSLKQEGISGSLIPTFGFEPDGAYLAGLYPDECDGGMHFWYSPETSPFKIAKPLLRYFDGFPDIFQRGLRKLSRIFVRRITNSSRPTCVPSFCIIPFKLISFFDLAEKYLLYEDKFTGRRSIFTKLRNNDKSFFFHGAPTCPTGVEDIYKGLVEADHPFDFIFLHASVLDSVGHRYGPCSDEISSALRSVDHFIKEIWTFLKKRYGEFNFVIIGDHGMVKVKEIVDIEARINELDMKIGKDYIYFLDSTIARFWFFNKHAKQVITSVLSNIEEGHIINEEEKNRYHLNYPHNKFGDLMFLIDPGFLIFPNFWNNTIPEMGMHGYAPEYSGQQSAFIIHSSFVNKLAKSKNPTDMRRIFPTLLKLTGLYTDNDHEVSSIV
jgi:predicted AlkP superfamily pyrophosphatase or phosphodiesterase